MRRPGRSCKLVLAAAVALFAGAPAALAARDDDPPLPWAGGAAVETPFEQYAGQLASAVAGRSVRVVCNSPTDWGQLASQHQFDPPRIWGFVVLTYDESTDSYRPGDSMQLSQPACFYLNEYWRAPAAEKGKLCQAESRPAFRLRTTKVKVTRQVQVEGTWRTRVFYVTRTTRVPIQKTKWSVCQAYMNRVFALQTISHESQHLFGLRDEATAECNGMQKLAWFARRFGATAEQARQMAGDYYRDLYQVERPGTPYYERDCPDPSA